jgi:hypothetical protein
MIAQVLNREFVRQALEQVEAYLSEAPAAERREALPGPAEAAELSPDDYQEALAHVRQSLGREIVESSGQPGFVPPPAERRGEETPPLDDFSFFSRDPVISNLQTSLEYYFTSGPEGRTSSERMTESPPEDERRGPGADVAVTARTLPGWQPRRTAEGRRLFEQFSITDIGWISAAVAMGVRLFRRRRKFENQPRTVRIADRSRVLLVGDWGTGIPRAAKVSAEMRKVIDDGIRENREQHVVHLGDVYYAGWRREYEERFLPYWPVKPEEADRIGSYCLNGNHDMYAGGHAYYDYLLKDPLFSKQGQCSFFCLENRRWKIFGLDTAWDDNGLKDPQAEWLRRQIDRDRATMLLSHHQPFSAFEKTGDVIPRKLEPVLSEGIRAWFWGHEHRCVLYRPHMNIQYGRIVGHGGVPVYQTRKEGDPHPFPSEYEYRAFLDAGIEHWALFGFAVLDFEDGRINVRYIDENGATHKQETLDA